MFTSGRRQKNPATAKDETNSQIAGFDHRRVTLE